MRIGIYEGSIPPPVFISNLIIGLANEGCKVFIYGRLLDRNFNFCNSNIIQKIFPDTKIRIIIKFIFLFISLIFKNSSSIFSIINCIRKKSNSLKDFIKRSCRIFPPLIDDLDIFHIQWAKTIVEYPDFLETINCPVILSLRGAHINYSPLSNKNLADSYKMLFPKITRFHAVSNAIKVESEKYNAMSDKITVIYPAVNNELLKIRRNYNSPQIKIISVGRCHWKKGYTFVLDAMSILRKEKVDFNYTIVAGGRDQENILYQIHDLGLNECVNFINNELSHDEVLKKISECDLFILPSLEEGISNAVIEAMALGVPVISTDCGGMREVIRSSENGFLVPVRDSESMAKSIRDFVDLDEMEKNNIIFNARETIKKKYCLSSQIDMFLELYRKVI